MLRRCESHHAAVHPYKTLVQRKCTKSDDLQLFFSAVYSPSFCLHRIASASLESQPLSGLAAVTLVLENVLHSCSLYLLKQAVQIVHYGRQ